MRPPKATNCRLRNFIRRDAIQAGLASAPVVYSALLALTGCAGIALAGRDAWPLAPAMAASGAALALGAWLTEYRRLREQYSACYASELISYSSMSHDEDLVRVAARLASVDEREGIRQVKALRETVGALREVIERKFNPGELTLQRYLAVTEQLFLSVLDNLERAAEYLTTATTIDGDEIRARPGPTAPPAGAHSRRAPSTDPGVSDLEQAARALLSKNAAVLASLADACRNLTTLNTKHGRAGVEQEHALKELKAMVGRIDRYAASSRRS